MSKRTKITLRSVRSLKPGEEMWDSEVVGFTARRREGDTSFCIVYRIGGQRRRYTIGKLGALTPDQAREAAKKLLGDVAVGLDPQGDKLTLRGAATVAELCDQYLADGLAGRLIGRGGKPKKASTVAFDRGAIEGHIKPLLGSRTVVSVTKADITRFMHDVAEGKTASTRKTKPRGVSRIRGGRGIATRVTGLLGGVMSHALHRGLIESNPVSRVRKFAENPRERRLSDEEYRMLSTGLRASEKKVWPPAIAALKFLALSGWRSGEALGLRWPHVDLVTRAARLDDTKTGKSMRPLSHAACDLLRSLPRNNDLVFPAQRGTGPMGGFKRHAKNIIAKAGLPADVTPHTLRHSFASVAHDLQYSDATIGMLIGHKGKATTTSRYVHGADAVLLAAADLVASKIVALMGDAKSDNKVIELRPSVNQIG